VKSEEAAVFMQCHCAGLPGTEDPRIVKAVRAAEKDRALQAELARQRAFDERNLTAIEQVTLPASFIGKLKEGHAAVRPLSGRKALMQPVVVAIAIGAAVLVGWAGVSVWNRAHTFPGKDEAMQMVEVNDQMTGMEMEPKKDPAAALNDWFFDKYGFESYFVPASFGDYQAVGARLFKQEGGSVAQVAIANPNMVFFSFKADDFGVSLPNDEWHIFTDGLWAAAIQQHEDEAFIVTFRGSAEDMDAFLKGKR
jgi:hypothetical protein